MDRLGKYEILETLGRGGMGVVYRARDLQLGRIVALKVLPEGLELDARRRGRFLREAQAAAALNHPNIATLYEVGGFEGAEGANGHAYLALEYVEGRDLDELLDTGLDEDEVIDLALQVARGLSAAHRHGVIHRDLKPHNVRVTAEGVVKILDFGLAKIAAPVTEGTEGSGDSFHTQVGAVMGTPPYMAPEQGRGEVVDSRADLFSLGVILFEMSTGRPPFRGRNFVEFLLAVERGDREPIDQLSPGLDPRLVRVIDDLLATDPEARPSSAEIVVERLDKLKTARSLFRERSESVVQSAVETGPARRISRAGWIVALAAVVLLVATLWAWRSQEAGSVAPPGPVRLAVLPFENLSGDPELDFLARGMGSVLSGELASAPELTVLSNTVTARYPPTRESQGRMVSDFGINRLLGGWVRGSLESGGSGVLARVELSDASTSTVLWSAELARDADDLAALQTDLAEGILRALDVAGGGRGIEPLTDSSEAFEQYLVARQIADGASDVTDWELASGYYDRALELDPQFARALAGRARASLEVFRQTADTDLLETALEDARDAVALDDGSVEALLTLARVESAVSDHRGALELLERVRELKTERAEVLGDHGVVLEEELGLDAVEARREEARALEEAGRLAEAADVLENALADHPRDWRLLQDLGALELNRGRVEAAIARFERAKELAPGEALPRENLAVARLMQGDARAAIEAYGEFEGPVSDWRVAANLGAAWYLEGNYEQSAKYLELATRLSRSHLLLTDLGDVYQLLKDPARAEREYAAAQEVLSRALEIFPTNVEWRLYRSLLDAKLGRCEAALEAVRTLGGELPRTRTQLLRLARTEALCGEPERALAVLEDAVENGATAGDIRSAVEFRGLIDREDFQGLLRGAAD